MIKNGLIQSINGTWVTVLTNCGKVIEVNTKTKTITKLKLNQLLDIVNSI